MHACESSNDFSMTSHFSLWKKKLKDQWAGLSLDSKLVSLVSQIKYSFQYFFSSSFASHERNLKHEQLQLARTERIHIEINVFQFFWFMFSVARSPLFVADRLIVVVGSTNFFVHIFFTVYDKPNWYSMIVFFCDIVSVEPNPTRKHRKQSRVNLIYNKCNFLDIFICYSPIFQLQSLSSIN